MTEHLKGLVIKPNWADLILDGVKTWEIRGSATKHRGPVYIIKSGSGEIFGAARLVECRPFTIDDYHECGYFHQLNNISLFTRYNQPWAWVFEDAVRFKEPLSYQHPQGAVIWVNLPHSILDDPPLWV